MARPKSTSLIPAAASGSAAPRRADQLFEQPHAGHSITVFEKAIGGRGELAADLLTSPDITPEIRNVLLLILDPRFDRISLAKLCFDARITPGQLFRAFRDAAMAKAHILVVREVAKCLPQIAKELLAAAVEHDATCPICNGLKITIRPPTRTKPERRLPCTRCQGTGRIRVPADFDRQKLALDLGGLLKNGPLVQVNHQDNRTLSLGSGSAAGLAQLQQAAASIIFGKQIVPKETAPAAPVIEAEAVPVP